jgi:hypothetical protein
MLAAFDAALASDLAKVLFDCRGWFCFWHCTVGWHQFFFLSRRANCARPNLAPSAGVRGKVFATGAAVSGLGGCPAGVLLPAALLIAACADGLPSALGTGQKFLALRKGVGSAQDITAFAMPSAPPIVAG